VLLLRAQQGKLHFGYVFGYGLLGCIIVYALINLMHHDGISFDRTVSILGYSMLPIVVIATIAPVVSLKYSCARCLVGGVLIGLCAMRRGVFGTSLSVFVILWCTFNATRYIEKALQMREQVRCSRFVR
jgi:hypothetical protein